MDKWEYTSDFFQITSNSQSPELLKRLNDHGQKGWEVVHINSTQLPDDIIRTGRTVVYYDVIMKRKIVE